MNAAEWVEAHTRKKKKEHLAFITECVRKQLKVCTTKAEMQRLMDRYGPEFVYNVQFNVTMEILNK